MAIIDSRAELTRAGANVEGRWSAVRFLVRRYPLGAFGVVIMALCVFAALFAPYITVYDPLSTNAAFSLARPSAQHWLGCDFMGRDVYSRIVYGSPISLAVGVGSLWPRALARGRDRLVEPGSHLRRPHRADIGLSRRLDRLGCAALDRHPAIAAPARHGIVDDRLARALAEEHDHRDFDRADPLFGPRRPCHDAVSA